MNRAYTLFLIFAVMIGSIAVTHAMVSEDWPEGVSCTSERIAAFGWTDKRQAMAELAAIAKWQNEAQKEAPGYSQWHQSRSRAIKCRKFNNSSHIQCQVSARPCRYGRASGA